MKKSVYILIMVILLLVSCTPSAESRTPVSIITQSLTGTLVPAHIKSSTSAPITPTATISVSSTPIRTPTSTPTKFASFLTGQVSWNICDGAREPYYETDLSPNIKWIAVSCQPSDLSNFVGTKVIRLDGTTTWVIPFYEFYGIYQKGELPPDGIKEGEMSIFHWSNDGNYVYLDPYFCCADSPQDIFFNYFNNTRALYRLDLRTGKIAVVLPPFKDNVFAGYYASFAPTDKYLVYVASCSPRDIQIYNLQSGDIFTVTVDDQYVASGEFSWSQDGDKTIFMAVKANWDIWQSPIKDGVSYFLMDLKEHKSIRLFDKEKMYRVSWTQGGNIILHNVSGSDGLLYDFQRNDFIIVTPTSVP